MPEDISVARSEEELDKLADSDGQPRNDSGRPMRDEPAPAAAAKTAAEEKWEFEHGGKKVAGNREQILKWAQMGYDRPQVMQKFNQEKTAWEKQLAERQGQFKQYEEKFKPYLEIDAFAQKNPQWWNHVLQSWQSRGNPAAVAAGAAPAGTGTDPRLDTALQRLEHFEQIVPKFEKLATEFEERQIAEQHKQEDDTLDQEIRSIREQHKDLDWNTLDADGKTLEVRVMEHAGKIGTQSFRAAMRDLLHDELVTRAEANAKIAVSKGIQTKSKLGVISQSDTPKSQWNPADKNRDIRKTSYEDLMREAIEEVRSGRVG